MQIVSFLVCCLIQKITNLNATLLSFLPDTVTVFLESRTPLFGRTQYRFGAVVFTLKHTFLSEGFVNFRSAVTTSLKGPETRLKIQQLICTLYYSLTSFSFCF